MTCDMWHVTSEIGSSSYIYIFSPNWPTGPIWSDSRDVRDFVAVR